MQRGEVKVMNPGEFRAEGEKGQPGAASQSPSCAECDQSPGHGRESQSAASAVTALDQGPDTLHISCLTCGRGLCIAAPQILPVTPHQKICLLAPEEGRQYWEVSSWEMA